MDFTLKKYIEIIEAGLEANYQFGPVNELFEKRLQKPFIVLRHDVDRKPKNSLAMARAEAQLGVRASYYFRCVKASFDPDIIREIRDLGHEIGYHYEDWYTARYDKQKALSLFKSHIAKLRAIAPIKTICMHGSPLSRDNNMTIWNHWDYQDYGVKDCILSYDYTGHAFFTDSGRTFGVSNANLRDELGNEDVYPDVRSSDDLIDFIKAKKKDQIMVSCHPERWGYQIHDWTTQFSKDMLTNSIKHGIRFVSNLRGKPI